MFQLTLQITDDKIEQVLINLAQQQNKKVSEVIMMVVEDFIANNEPLNYKKLDPKIHLTTINYPITNENLDDVVPFAGIKDASRYVHKLRQQIWNQNT